MIGQVSSTSLPASVSLQDFLNILTTQLTYQDPLKPMDNQEFMAQIAQFTSLQLTQQISTDTRQLISNDAALQSVGLIGKTVSIKQADGQVFSGTVTSLALDGNSPTISVRNSANSTEVPNISLSQVVAVRNPS